MNTLCLGDRTLPRKGGTEKAIAGEEAEAKVNLSKMATRWDFFFSSRSVRKQENLVLFFLYIFFNIYLFLRDTVRAG